MLASVAKDRVITKFPQAYHPDATPNEQITFSTKVQEATQQNRTGTVGYVELGRVNDADGSLILKLKYAVQ